MREPARAWIGIAFAILLFLCIPYPFAGTYTPVVDGLPLWFLTVLAASLGLVGLTIYVVVRHWHLAAIALGEKDD